MLVPASAAGNPHCVPTRGCRPSSPPRSLHPDLSPSEQLDRRAPNYPHQAQVLTCLFSSRCVQSSSALQQQSPALRSAEFRAFRRRQSDAAAPHTPREGREGGQEQEG
eukprot:2913024-Rhodomonas_salina.1